MSDEQGIVAEFRAKKGESIGEVILTAKEVVVLGQPVSNDEAHNCDAMGCGNAHVLGRIALPPRPSAGATPEPYAYEVAPESDGMPALILRPHNIQSHGRAEIIAKSIPLFRAVSSGTEELVRQIRGCITESSVGPQWVVDFDRLFAALDAPQGETR